MFCVVLNAANADDNRIMVIDESKVELSLTNLLVRNLGCAERHIKTNRITPVLGDLRLGLYGYLVVHLP